MTKTIEHKIDISLETNHLRDNYKIAKLGRSLKLCLNDKQVTKLSQWLGCIRKIKNIKIAEINNHNEKLLSHTQRNLFKQFKENHPNIKDNENPYRYIFPDQGYAFAKELIISFVGPLEKDKYNDIYINNKHYLERVPSEVYRNSMKDLMEGNKKYIKDYFDSKILYHNKRKELIFIKKSDDRDSLFISSSDKLFKFIDNRLYIGKNIEKSLLIEQELKCLNKKLKLINSYINNPDKYLKLLTETENKVKDKINNKALTKESEKKDLQIKPKNKRNKSTNKTRKLSKKEIELIGSIKDLSKNNLDNLVKELEDKIVALNLKLNKDMSYIGELKFNKAKVNKSYKEINFNSIKGIRIKRLKDNFYISFSFDYINEYTPSLFDINNKEEILNKEQLALYLKEITDKYGKQKTLDYLVGKILGIDRGINQRLTLSINNSIDQTSDENVISKNNNDSELNGIEDKYLSQFLSYEPEIKAYIEKLKKQIEYHNKQLKRRTVNSRGYNKSKQRYRKLHGKIANIKRDINHKVTNHIISSYSQPIIALEKLNIKGMTKRAIPKVDIKKSLDSKFNIKHGLDELKLKSITESLEEFYKSNVNKVKYKDIVGDYKLSFMKNKASAKSGLNESILTQNWGQFGLLIEYKGNLHGKIVIEVDPKYTSQECSICGYIEAGNRVKSKFCCLKCNHKEHADSNASKVIAGRVYKELLLYAEELMYKKDKENKTKSKDKDKNSNVEIGKESNLNKFNAPWDMGIAQADGNNKVK